MMGLGKKTIVLFVLVFYATILFLALSIYRMPFDKLVSATISYVTKGMIVCNAEEATLNLPMRLELADVSYNIFRGNNPINDQLESVSIQPVFSGILQGYLPIAFDGNIYRGRFNGLVGISIVNGFADGYLNFGLSEIQLEDAKFLQSISKRNIKGIVNGKMKTSGDLLHPAKMRGEGHIQVEQGSIDSRINLPAMKTIRFNNVRLNFTMNDGVIMLEDSEMVGPAISGVFSGKVEMSKDISDSVLRLEAKMKPGPSLINDSVAKQFLPKLGEKGVLRIEIQGTFDNPTIKWSNN